MSAREFQQAGNTSLVPAFVEQPYHLPSGLIDILELMKVFYCQLQLERHRIFSQKLLQCVVVSFVAELALENAGDLAKM